MKWIILQKILSYGAVRTSEVPTISKSSRVCSCVHLLSLRRAGVLLYEEDSSVSRDIFNFEMLRTKTKYPITIVECQVGPNKITY